jgi:hypothetical protein
MARRRMDVKPAKMMKNNKEECEIPLELEARGQKRGCKSSVREKKQKNLQRIGVEKTCRIINILFRPWIKQKFFFSLQFERLL